MSFIAIHPTLKIMFPPPVHDSSSGGHSSALGWLVIIVFSFSLSDSLFPAHFIEGCCS